MTHESGAVNLLVDMKHLPALLSCLFALLCVAADGVSNPPESQRARKALADYEAAVERIEREHAEALEKARTAALRVLGEEHARAMKQSDKDEAGRIEAAARWVKTGSESEAQEPQVGDPIESAKAYWNAAPRFVLLKITSENESMAEWSGYGTTSQPGSPAPIVIVYDVRKSDGKIIAIRR